MKIVITYFPSTDQSIEVDVAALNLVSFSKEFNSQISTSPAIFPKPPKSTNLPCG